MKHTNTKSDIETLARKLYKTAETGKTVPASVEAQKDVRRYAALSEQMDAIKLELSEISGRLMEEMKDAETLVDDRGIPLATFKNGAPRRKVDVDALVLAYNIPPKEVAKYTVETPVARTFSVVV